MAGNTATIDEQTLRMQWDSYIPMAAICTHWTITKDQLVRLRDVWELPLRLDRSRRYKPGREEKFEEPDANELAASEASLDLAPMIAERATTVRAMWSDTVRAERQVTKPTAFKLARVEAPEEMREMLDNLNRELEW